MRDLKQIGWIYKITYSNGLNDNETHVVVPAFGHVGCALLILQRSWPGALVRAVESVGPLYDELQWKDDEVDKPTAPAPATPKPEPARLPEPATTVDTMVRQECTAPPVEAQHQWQLIEEPSAPNYWKCLRCGMNVKAVHHGELFPCVPKPPPVPAPMPVRHEWSYVGWANQYQCLQCRIVVNTKEDGDTLRCHPPESPNPYEEVTHRSHPADVPRAAGGYAEPNYHQSHDWYHPLPSGQTVCRNCATYMKPDNPSARQACKPSRQAQAYFSGLRQPAPKSATPIPPEEDC